MVKVHLTKSGHKKVFGVFGVSVDQREPLIVDKRDFRNEYGIIYLTLRINDTEETFILTPEDVRSTQAIPVAVAS